MFTEILEFIFLFLNIYYPTIHSYELHNYLNYLNSNGTFFPLSVKK